MRVIAALLIVAIICQGALAVTSKSQSKLLLEKINAKLDRSHLGRALKNMVTIASKLGYNYEDLYDAFNALKNSLLGKLDAENELFEELTASHDAAVAQFNADISRYSQEITDGEAHLNDLNNSLHNFQNLLQEAQDSLRANQDALAGNQRDLEELNQTYQVEVDDYANARAVIAQAVQHLNDAQAHYDNANLGEFNFVQLKTSFISFAQQITAATQNMKAKHQLFVKPVVQAMMQVKSSADQSSIQVAINALNELQAYFDKALNDLTTLYVALKESIEATIASLNEIINILQNETIPNYENQISVLQAEVQQAEEALALARQNLANAQQGLADENDAYSRVQARHDALVARINSEYDLVDQAERIIRTAEASLEE